MAKSIHKTATSDAGKPEAENQSSLDVASGIVEPYENKTLEQNFSVWSTLGVSYSITATPLAIGSFLVFSIGVGGSPVFLYGYLLSVTLNICICASLAEISASFPHPSGQAYWTAVLAPQRYARALSYWTGAFSSAAWFYWTAGTFLISSQMIWAFIEICNGTPAQTYQVYLLYLAVAVLATIVNIPLFKYYPAFLKGMVVFINAGSIFMLVALLVRAHPKQSAKSVFVDISNETGWASNGVVFFLGLLPGVTAVNGFDSAAHMADELPNPKRQVPQVMIGNALLSGISGIPMIITFLFCVTNVDNLLTPIGGQPIAQLLVDSLNSKALTIIAMIIYLAIYMVASTSITTTSSRVWWSFARDGGLPFSHWLGKVNEHYRLPVNAIFFSLILNVLIGLLELGATTVLNAIIGCAAICFYISYGIPIVCLLINKRKSFPQTRYFNLGKWGPVLNVIGLVWGVFISVWLTFPLYLPVTAATMNYASVVLAATVFVFGLVWGFHGKKAFMPGFISVIPRIEDSGVDNLDQM